MSRRILLPVGDRVRDPETLFSLIESLILPDDRITIFHVVTAPETTPLDKDDLSCLIEERENLLKDVCEALLAKGLKVDKKVGIARNVAEAIVSEAEEGNYDLILMLKRSRKGFIDRMFRRSISSRVACLTKKPVITVLVDEI